MTSGTGVLRGLLLDVDGTLLDSVQAHAEAWANVLDEDGIDVSSQVIRPLIGMGGDKLLPAVAGISSESERGKRLGARRGEVFRTWYLPNLRPFPMVRPLLQTLRGYGLRLVVATSAAEEDLAGLLARSGVQDLLEASASGDDVERSKPDPDIVTAALASAGMKAPETIMIGDTRWDVEAAARAGVPCIAVRSGGSTDADLSGAVAIYADAADLLAHLDTSPIGVRLGVIRRGAAAS